MLKHYLTVALRALRSHLVFSGITIGGFAVGMACCMLIALYVLDEASYDRFHVEHDHIYRIVQEVLSPEGVRVESDVPAPLGPAARSTLPEVLATVRFSGNGYVFEHEGVRYQENALFYADSSVFDVFSFAFRRGDPSTALKEPFSLVLTETAARKYFGDGDPLGQTLIADGVHTFTVTGILADVPPRSHLQFDMLLSMSTGTSLFGWLLDDWHFGGVYTYALLKRGQDVAAVESKLTALYRQHSGGQEEEGTRYALRLEPLTAIHLNEGGVRPTLYLFAFVAVFILAIAGVNFMNLSTARAAERVREIGVRKALGAQRQQLMLQFLSETVLLSLFAVGLAYVLAFFAFPFFEALSGKNIDVTVPALLGYAPPVIVGAVFVGLLAGLYPAAMLPRYQPIRALQGLTGAPGKASGFRKGLVVFQFAFTTMLIAATSIIYAQLDYVHKTNLGFDRRQILVIDFGGDAGVKNRIETIKTQLARHPAVTRVSASGNVPGDYFAVVPTSIEGPGHTTAEVRMAAYSVDYDFLSFYGMRLVAGRGFSPDFTRDADEALVLNRQAVAALGYASSEEVLGKPYALGRRRGHIIGVVEDFHFESLHHTVQPLTLQIAPSNMGYLSLHVHSEDIQRTIAELSVLWQRLVPERPFQYRFLDQSFDAHYRADERLGALFGTFALLAITIACLGLLALTIVTAARRRKEIGIRKALGASVAGIVLLLSRHFLSPIGIAFLIATPLTYLAMQRWLDTFAYRMELSPGLFFRTGVLVFLVASLTIGYQSLRAALADPVKSLRYE